MKAGQHEGWSCAGQDLVQAGPSLHVAGLEAGRVLS